MAICDVVAGGMVVIVHYGCLFMVLHVRKEGGGL